MSKTKSKSPNKSAFVRSLPENLSAKEVVSKAKVAGMILTENYVYTIRSAAKNKKKSGKVPGRPGRPKGSKNAVSASSTSLSSSSSQARFIEATLDLGLGNAVRLLEKLRQQIKAVTLG